MLPTLNLSHGKKAAMTRAKDFLKGEWKSLREKLFFRNRTYPSHEMEWSAAQGAATGPWRMRETV